MDITKQQNGKEKEPAPQPVADEVDPQDLKDLQRASWEGMIAQEEPKPASDNKSTKN